MGTIFYTLSYSSMGSVPSVELNDATKKKITDAVVKGLAPYNKELKAQMETVVKANDGIEFDEAKKQATSATEKNIKLKNVKKQISTPLKRDLRADVIAIIDGQSGDNPPPTMAKNKASDAAITAFVGKTVDAQVGAVAKSTYKKLTGGGEEDGEGEQAEGEAPPAESTEAPPAESAE